MLSSAVSYTPIRGSALPLWRRSVIPFMCALQSFARAAQGTSGVSTLSTKHRLFFAARKQEYSPPILANKNIHALRSRSHFVSDKQAAQFADTLEATLKQGTFFDIDKWPLCGRAFTKQNRLCLLADDRIVHKKCFWNAVRDGELSHDDTKVYWYHLFQKIPLCLTSRIWMARPASGSFDMTFKLYRNDNSPISYRTRILQHKAPRLFDLRRVPWSDPRYQYQPRETPCAKENGNRSVRPLRQHDLCEYIALQIAVR